MITKIKNVAANKGGVRIAKLRNLQHQAGRLVAHEQTVDLSAEFTPEELQQAQMEIQRCITRGWLVEINE